MTFWHWSVKYNQNIMFNHFMNAIIVIGREYPRVGHGQDLLLASVQQQLQYGNVLHVYRCWRC